MRVAILSDIHANLEALEAVLEHLARRRYDAIWFLGDAVGYGGDPEAILHWLREREPGHLVRGNHDKVVAGIEEPDGFSSIAREAALRTRSMVSEAGLRYLRMLPRGPVAVTDEVSICHGSWINEDYYILFPNDAEETFEQMRGSLLFFGHTHRACLYGQLDGGTFEIPCSNGTEIVLQSKWRYLINPGSVGQPRDRDPRAAYILFDTEERRIAFFRVPYDIETAQRKIIKAGLPEMNAARLAEGR